MQVKEISNFNLFQTIADKKDLGIFDFLAPKYLDMYYPCMYGERTLSNLYTNNTIDDLAEIVIGFYGTKWDSLLAYITKSIPVLENYGEKLTETITDSGNIVTDHENTNSVTGFDSEDFVNDNKEVSKDTTTYNDKKQVREQIINKINYADMQNIVKYLQSNFVYDTIFVDVNSLITLSIFSISESEE